MKSQLLLNGAVFLLLAATVGSPRAFAQADELALGGFSEESLLFPEIRSVYSASKYEQSISQAPSSVTVVTADEISTYGYQNLSELFASIRGFNVNYDRNYYYTGVRGFNTPGDYNSRLLVLLDGRRVNEPVYDGVLLGNGFIVPVEMIERVEIVRGPGSSVYGTNAFFGVVNIVTKQGRDMNGSSVSVDGASRGGQRIFASYGTTGRSGIDLALAVSHRSIDGDTLYYPEYDAPETNDGFTSEADYETAEHVFVGVGYEGLRANVAAASRKKGVPTGSYATVFGARDTHTLDESLQLNLRYDRQLTSKIGFRGDISYQDYRYLGHYMYDYELPSLVANHDETHAEFWTYEASFDAVFERHRLNWGAEYRDVGRRDQTNFDMNPFWVYLDDQRSGSSYGVYINDDFEVSERFSLSAGLRLDEGIDGESRSSPRLATIFTLSERDVLKVLYGTAFREANAYELYYELEDEQQAAGTLGAEELESFEIVWERDLGQNIRLITSVFRNDLTDLLTLTTDPVSDLLVFQNIDAAHANGLEIEIEGRFARSLQGRISYSYQDVTDTSGRRPNAPEALFKANLTKSLLDDRLRVAGELQHVASQLSVSGVDIGSYTTVNLSISGSTPWSGVSYTVSALNLLDEEYWHPASEEHLQPGIMQDGRTFRARLNWRF